MCYYMDVRKGNICSSFGHVSKIMVNLRRVKYCHDHAERIFRKVTVIGKKLRVKLTSYKLNPKTKMTIHPRVRGLAWRIQLEKSRLVKQKNLPCHATSMEITIERLAKFRLRERVI